jgi:hypothetical protein
MKRTVITEKSGIRKLSAELRYLYLVLWQTHPRVKKTCFKKKLFIAVDGAKMHFNSSCTTQIIVPPRTTKLAETSRHRQQVACYTEAELLSCRKESLGGETC